jgi:cellulose synthase/poly-beta-1,6-N-acetylglucosamine synthase-like glycosyltransferase
MIALISFLLTAAGFAVLLIVIVLAAEVVASFFHRAPEAPPASKRGPLAVVIPAHDEEAGIGAAVAAARTQLAEGDRILVVADNCSDATAAAARAAGAEVAERQDAEHRGKGYALQHGVDHLRASPPEAVVFFDADCDAAPGAIDRIARLAVERQRPAQALYLARPAVEAGPASAVSAFAWLLLNRVRMTGLQTLGGFSRLTGSGMAFPWALAAERRFATGEIVEDLAMTVALIGEGTPPLLDTIAVVESELARSGSGAAIQRARWELGSLRLAVRQAGALFARGLGGDWRALLMSFDLLVPPLTVLGAVIVLGCIVSIPFALAGRQAPLAIFWDAGLLFVVVIGVAWFAYGRTVLPPKTLAGLGDYLLGKLRVYGGEGRESARRWTRTDRGDEK